MKPFMILLLLANLLISSAAFAEYKSIDLSIYGMD